MAPSATDFSDLPRRITSYEIIGKIGESHRATVYKARDKKDPNRSVVLKVLKTTNLSPKMISLFKQRIEYLGVLNDPGVITPTAMEVEQGICFIVHDYFDGVSLDKLLGTETRLEDFFILACGLTGTLEKVHEAGFIHAGIKPHNILVKPDTLETRLIDFVRPFDVSDLSHFIYEHSFVRQTLAYTSPEQTGRINHRVTFASDLYSLGIIFYELLNGAPPFLSEDPLELIHSHLAREPARLPMLHPKIPGILHKIVAKLLLKQPEKRYQSCRGLLADLERCRDEYSFTGSIYEFPLEGSAHASTFGFTSKLVGRQKEKAVILEEYEQAAKGNFRGLLISGLPGIGKTRLVQELEKSLVEHRGYFTSGKFDAYQKNIPYSSLIQAFKNLIRVFLTERDDRVELWKARILNAVGKNGKVLADIIPGLEVLIGPQPEIQALPPAESLKRFHDTFDRFLASLAGEDNPLTLFVDDLQWCDTASLDFLANLFENHRDHPYLFFLGAYRENEVAAWHPLSNFLRNVGNRGQPLREMSLGPLRLAPCHRMISNIFNSTLAQTKELSDFIYALSEGNPLFVTESLSYLYNENLLFLDEDRKWRWDFDRIRRSSMPATVVALFRLKISKLSPDLGSALEYGACIGSAFSPTELSSVMEMSPIETFNVLKPALQQGLLTENGNQLQFIHDRVQEAALSLIPEARLRRIHKQIGRHLLASVPPEADLEKVENLFTIVSHLNLGREQRLQIEEACFLSDVNYHAGSRAFDSLAIEAANNYFGISLELLPPDCWEDEHYERTFRKFQKAAKTELMCGNSEKSERLLNELLDHARSELDKVECLAEQTVSLSSTGNLAKAIETAKRGLAHFGYTVPVDLKEVEVMRQALMDEIHSRNVSIPETYLNMPFAEDRRSRIEHAFYSDLLADLYISGRLPEVYLVAAMAILHCLSAGMDESVMYAFTAMAIYFAEKEEFEQSFLYEDLTGELAAKYPNTFGATKCMTGRAVTLMHSRSSPGEIADYCRKAIQCGKSCGDLNNAGYSYGALMWNLQILGQNLSGIEDYIRECLQFANRYHLPIPGGIAEAMEAGWVAPMRKDFSPLSKEAKLKKWEKNNDWISAGSFCFHAAMAHYYVGEHEEAGRYLARAQNYLPALSNTVIQREWRVFKVLNALKLYEKAGRFVNEGELMAEIGPNLDKIRMLARLGPLLKPFLAFIDAELERVLGEPSKARGLYLDAIDVAHDHGYSFLEAHLHEILGNFLLDKGKASYRPYFIEAARLYRECGAERKEALLIQKHPDYFGEQKTFHKDAESVDFPPSTLPNLDVNYLMKSSLAISAEIEQEKLLKKIMDAVIESSGAQHGYLLIAEQDRLSVRAQSHLFQAHAPEVPGLELDKVPDICKSIVRYVYRTGEKLILTDAAREGAFRDDPEARRLHLRSVLCLPVVRQLKTIGILYLENRLSDSVFTSEKTQITELLTLQAAISLENATLFIKHEQAEQALQASENELRLIMDAAPALISYVNSDHRYRRVNKSYERWFGKSGNEIQGRHVREVLGDIVWQTAKPNIDRVLSGEQVAFQHQLPVADGGTKWVEVTLVPDHDESGRVCGFVVHASDIEEMKRAEEAIKQSLKEKVILLKEIHHRVKNSLQIIQSLLNLQLPYIKDEKAIEIFKESQNRIFSMALIHEKLYGSESLARIDLYDYFKSLIANLFASYGVNERAIKAKIEVNNVVLDINTLIPSALIINELVSNSLRHGFPDSWKLTGAKGQIGIEIRHDPLQGITLVVGDDGVGLPAGFSMLESKSLGLKIVNVLVKQLGGTIHHDAHGKAEFRITFPQSIE